MESIQQLLQSYNQQAEVLEAEGRFDEAMALHQKREELCLQIGDHKTLWNCFDQQAFIHYSEGRLEEALGLIAKQEDFCRQWKDSNCLQLCYGNYASVFEELGRIEESFAMRRRKEQLCLESGNRHGLAHCYWAWGLAESRQSRPAEAVRRLSQALAIFTELNSSLEREAVQEDLDALTQAKVPVDLPPPQ